jgi:hypothetical protein
MEFPRGAPYTWRFALGRRRTCLLAALLPSSLPQTPLTVLLFMTTNKLDVAAPARENAVPATSPPQNVGRLVALLSVLVLAIGALAYDYLGAKPSCEAADKKIQDFVDSRNKLGVKEGALVTPADIHKELGMPPTKVEKHDKEQYMVEYYCWWGPVPFINMRRHFISVVYNGQDPNWRFSSHHREMPPEEALPIDRSTLSDDQSVTKEGTNLEPSAATKSTPETGTDESPAKASPAPGADAKEPATTEAPPTKDK